MSESKSNERTQSRYSVAAMLGLLVLLVLAMGAIWQRQTIWRLRENRSIILKELESMEPLKQQVYKLREENERLRDQISTQETAAERSNQRE